MDSLYKVGERDLIDLGQSYCDHVSHMTSEKLQSKSDIAAELAFRDNKINELSYEIKQLKSRIDRGQENYQLMLDKIIEHKLFDEVVQDQVDKYNKIFSDSPALVDKKHD